MRSLAAVVILAASVGACSLDDAQARSDDHENAEGAVESAKGVIDDATGVVGPAEWVGTTSGGTHVTVQPDRYPVVVGKTEFQITLDRPVSEGTAVSIDIVSPDMPAMGVVRYLARDLGDLSYVAWADFSMGGAWEVYVNLGEGTDAVGFAFEVESDGDDHAHGEMAEGTHDERSEGH